MNRYISSFVATSLLYVTLMATFLYAYQEPKIAEQKNKKSEQNVRFTIVSQKLEKPKPKKIVKKIEPKKVEPKKIVKKVKPKKVEPKKIVKKVIPKKVVPKKIVKKIEPKKVIEKIVEKVEPKKIVKKIVKVDEPKRIIENKIVEQKELLKKSILKDQITKNENLKKQRALEKKIYLEKLKETINKNKSYPRTAVRREIEGDVKLTLTVSPSGELICFEIIEGDRVFKKSIKKAMEKSFPFKPKEDILLSNLDLSLTISYKLF